MLMYTNILETLGSIQHDEWQVKHKRIGSYSLSFYVEITNTLKLLYELWAVWVKITQGQIRSINKSLQETLIHH